MRAMRCIFLLSIPGVLMRSYRMYETVDPDRVITEDDFFLASQRMEKTRLGTIVESVKKLILSRNMRNCRSIRCFHHDEDLKIRRSYEVAIIIKSLMSQAIESGAQNVTLITELSDGVFSISVLDDGDKISDQARRLLFAPKVKPDGDSYLRFYNVRKAVIRCKGKMKLGEDQNGNIFTVSLPAEEVAAFEQA